jgi:hypothetical protein
VALSLVRRTWWGPDSIAEAAREWSDCVRNGREAARLERYVEIRYEDLLADPAPVVERLFEGIGLESSTAASEAALAELRVARNVEPGDRIGVGKWRGALSRRDLATFERIAGPTMRELGYEPEAAASPRARLSGLARRARGLTRRRASPRRRAEAQVEDVVESAALLDRLLTAAREGREEEILDLLDPAPEALLLGPGGEIQAVKGEQARGALARALVGDPALRGRQVAGRVLPGRPVTVVALEFELPDGGRAGRFIAIDARDRRVKQAIVAARQPG